MPRPPPVTTTTDRSFDITYACRHAGEALLCTTRTKRDSRDPMGMSERWREEWQVFRHSVPGQRFRERYERVKALERPMTERVARCVCGVVTVLVGLVLVPLPGPGW